MKHNLRYHLSKLFFTRKFGRKYIDFSCGIAPSAANAMVTVFGDLRVRRSAVGVFSASDGLMTLRDLFRWGRRLAGSEQADWRQCLAEHGKLCEIFISVLLKLIKSLCSLCR